LEQDAVYIYLLLLVNSEASELHFVLLILMGYFPLTFNLSYYGLVSHSLCPLLQPFFINLS